MLNKWQENAFSAIINQDLIKLKENFALEEKKDLSFTDNDGNTLLHFASDRISEKTLPIVQFLLENGCDPQAVNARFETPLDRAKKSSNIPAMTVIKHYIYKQNQELLSYLD